jgi:subtilisin family serine protease
VLHPLCGFPFPWNHPLATSLHAALYEAYPVEQQALQVIEAAGLDSFQFVRGQSPAQLWESALQLAGQTGLTRQLIQTIHDRQPPTSPIRALLADILAGRPAAEPEDVATDVTGDAVFDRQRVIAALRSLSSDAADAVYAEFAPVGDRPTTPDGWVTWAEKTGPGLVEFVLRAHRVDPLAGFLQAVRPDVRRKDRAVTHATWSILGGAESVSGSPDDRTVVPVLIAVHSADQQLDVPGFRLVSRTGRILAGVGNRTAIRTLEAHPGVVSVEASPPSGKPDCAVSVPFVRATAVQTGYSERGERALVGVIDVGIDVLHEAFRDENGKSRIVAVWDQQSTQGPPPPGQQFGTYHSREDLARYLETGKVERGLQPGYECHGTHVASIAAGRACGGAGGFSGGVAPAAKVVVVLARVYAESGSPDSLGYSVTHAAALNFINTVAEQENLPVVVNVSLGAQTGGHDGMSLLELMFDEFSGGGRHPRRVVVKSAGNDGERRLHATVAVNGSMVNRLRWRSPPRDTVNSPSGRRCDVLDCWFPPQDELHFRLTDPSGHDSPEVHWATTCVSWTTGTGNNCLLEYERFDQDNGDSRLRVAIGGGAVPIQAGEWQLKITSGPLRKPIELHAWVDRILDAQPVEFMDHTVRGSLSVPGTARTVIGVGAVVAADPVEVPAFSSHGGTRDGREKPEVSAPGVNILAAASHTQNQSRPESGTSMAAPHVTGAIALLLSHSEKAGRRINANQILGALRGSTRNGNAGWHPGSGYGVIDVEALFHAFGFQPPVA